MKAGTDILVTFKNLRNQVANDDNAPNFCLSDFIAPKETGLADYIGAFAVTAGIGTESLVKKYKQCQRRL